MRGNWTRINDELGDESEQTMSLTTNFTLSELCESKTAKLKNIDNTPDDAVFANLVILARGLERVRALLGEPMRISSGYRSPALNKSVGGSAKSAHMRGLAADFTAPQFGTPLQISQALAPHATAIGFDQLIFEGSWLHIGFPEKSTLPRYEILTATFINGKAVYSKGIT